MPSWNIHTAHVERLLSRGSVADLGIEDENAFLFGNFAPDIYVGYMVPAAAFRIDYCITHVARPALITVPDADRFWDDYIAVRRPEPGPGLSLVLGAWAHLVADRFYNGRFRSFWLAHDVPGGDEQRWRKQADFDLFGRSLDISLLVEPTPELMDAARGFRPYGIQPDDVLRAVDVARAIVRGNSDEPAHGSCYRLLDADWMEGTFDACDERVATWLAAWRELEARGGRVRAADIRAEAALPPATPDDPGWMGARR